MLRTRQSTLMLTALIAGSLLWTLLRRGPLHGSIVALVMAVAAQVYLPGYVLARVLGKTRLPHPIARFAWVLVCGLALTITLGGAARLFSVPVAVYLLALHGLLLVLAWLPAGASADADSWCWSWRRLPLYGMVLAACVVVVGLSYGSRYRFFGFEDQVLFASQAGWLATNTTETPTGGPLRARQIGVLTGDTRFDTDGWTYNHASWSWASGVSTAQIIWFDLNPLFLWTVPLAVFALAYEVTRREEAAAWSVAALVLVSLLTLDNIVYNPIYTAYGRLGVLQINTLRQFSLALMLPLTLMVGFTYLRTQQTRDLLLLVLAGAALALLHPFQITLFALSIGVTAGLRWLLTPGRRAGLVRLMPLLLALAVVLALPFVQRLNRSGLGAADTLIDATVVEAAEATLARGEFLILPNLPLVGATYIRNPARVFYHPVIVLVVALGLLYGLRLRRSLAAPYIFGTTAVFLLISFLPGLTELFNQFASSVGLLTTLFLLPVPLVLGLSLDHLLRGLAARLKVYPAWPVSVLLLGFGAPLLFEPLPIEASARDQLHAFNEMQASRRLRPGQRALTERLREVLPADRTTILMTPADSASVVIEDLPRTLITGGREGYNRARDGDNRFYNQRDFAAPWLDSADLIYMAEWGVTHIVSRADHTRLPQLALQPECFPLLDTVAGQMIFARADAGEPDAIDALFARMNAAYRETPLPRWTPQGFEMVRPGRPESWLPLVAAWRRRLDEQPDEDRARLGLAFAYLMAGEDAQALPLWQALQAAHPELALLNDALAHTHAALGDAPAGAAVLLAALAHDAPDVRVLAARSLLSETFFYLLDAEGLDRLLAVTEAEAVTWDYLAVLDRPDEIRQQAALWLSVGRWDTAIAWLDRLPAMMVTPRDLTAQAVAALAQGDVAAALERLQPATDPGWRAAKAFWGPDRWAENHAERMYYLLAGDLALREGRYAEAERAYQQAVELGAGLAGQYGLAQTLEQAGQAELAAPVRAAYEAGRPANVAAFVPLLALAESGNPYVMQPAVEQQEADNSLTITATYGDFQPQRGYPVQFWRIEVISPDAAAVYARADVPAVRVENALVRTSTTLTLPEDLDELTPALVVITPAHNNAVTYPPAVVPVTLNRPASAAVPAAAEPVGRQFGDAITLDSFTLDTSGGAIDLTLYWWADALLPEDYQVFVHVLDAEGAMLAQDDSAPLQGRYPTSQWRSGVLIADPHHIALDPLPEAFGVRVGLYRLPDGARLPVTPADARVADDSVLIYER